MRTLLLLLLHLPCYGQINDSLYKVSAIYRKAVDAFSDPIKLNRSCVQYNPDEVLQPCHLIADQTDFKSWFILQVDSLNYVCFAFDPHTEKPEWSPDSVEAAIVAFSNGYLYHVDHGYEKKRTAENELEYIFLKDGGTFVIIDHLWIHQVRLAGQKKEQYFSFPAYDFF